MRRHPLVHCPIVSPWDCEWRELEFNEVLQRQGTRVTAPLSVAFTCSGTRETRVCGGLQVGSGGGWDGGGRGMAGRYHGGFHRPHSSKIRENDSRFMEG